MMKAGGRMTRGNGIRTGGGQYQWPISLLTAVSAVMVCGSTAAQQLPAGGSGLPLPRFVSLKSDRVNIRTGPGTDYPTQWIYRRAGLPVEVIREVDSWRQVRDSEGATGWVLASLLSGRRTALVEPWELKPDVPTAEIALKADDRETSGDVARVEAGVIASLRNCNGRWCAVTIGEFRGYLEQRKLWGVYPGESGRW